MSFCNLFLAPELNPNSHVANKPLTISSVNAPLNLQLTTEKITCFSYLTGGLFASQTKYQTGYSV